MVSVAQLVRASDCGSEGRGFESHLSPFFFYMVNVAQLVRASDCGSEGRGFEPHLSPLLKDIRLAGILFLYAFLCDSFSLENSLLYYVPECTEINDDLMDYSRCLYLQN